MTTTLTSVGTAVTALFVPGDRPERFVKAAASGADLVVIDLEDAVEPDRKADALNNVLRHLAPGPDTVHALVRVNAQESDTLPSECTRLLELANRSGHGLLGIMIPKTESPSAVRKYAVALAAVPGPPLALVLLIESAVGIQNLTELARIPGVTRLAFGEIDFALDIRSYSDDSALDYARSAIVIASRAAGLVGPLASPSLEITKTDRVAESAAHARNYGFTGKLCIHPAQLASVSGAFHPSAAEVAWAHSVVGATGGAAQVNGQMIDLPVILRARDVLLRQAAIPDPVALRGQKTRPTRSTKPKETN